MSVAVGPRIRRDAIREMATSWPSCEQRVAHPLGTRRSIPYHDCDVRGANHPSIRTTMMWEYANCSRPPPRATRAIVVRPFSRSPTCSTPAHRHGCLGADVTQVEHSQGKNPTTSAVSTWLDQSRSFTWSLSAWTLASGVFVTLTMILGGPTTGDSAQSVYSALLMAHGNWSCAYPPAAFSHLDGFALVFSSPVYTLISALFARLFDLGGAIAFPSATSLGVNCSHAITQVASWAQSTNVLTTMLRFGFVAWLVLAAGVVATLRAAHKGRNAREAAALMAIACSAPVFSCLEASFHPEDVMTMGMILLAVASLLRQRWWLVGVVMALAVITQLFALLALIPLAMALPRQRRVIGAVSFATTLAAVVLPLAILTSGRVMHSVLFGTSKAGGRTRGAGGTVLSSAGLHGVALFMMSRVVPLVAAALVTYLVTRNRGDAVRQPVIVVALVGTCLSFRLVFEVNAFGYYYMATVVALLVLDALRGRVRGETFALIALITVAYTPVALYFRWRGQLAGPEVRAILPYVVSIPVVVALVASVVKRRVKWYLVGWLLLVGVAFIRVPVPVTHYKAFVHSWFWQLVLVSSMLSLLSAPLRHSSVGPEVAPTTNTPAG